jgi:NADPH:quinone reductase-like Zn-dependent oxidoreductase
MGSIQGACFAGMATTPADVTLLVPSGLDFQQPLSLPVQFTVMNGNFSNVYVCDVGKGEHV